MSKANKGIVASSYVKQPPPVPYTLLYSNNMDGGSRRSYSGATVDYIDNLFAWSAQNMPGYQLQFQAQIGWETNGVNHQMSLAIPSVGVILQINGAGDVGSGVTQASPWTNVPQSWAGTVQVWDGIPGSAVTAHFGNLNVWYRFLPRS
jgi:hypothetical protein